MAGALAPSFGSTESERCEVGTFEKVYVVDGESFELYAQEGRGGRRFQLVDSESLPIGASFPAVPDEQTVVALVRAVNDVDESAA
jgi:Lon protease-like protein